MAALLSGRGVSISFGQLRKIFICQPLQFCQSTYFRKKHSVAIENKCQKSSFVLSCPLLQSRRQFCDRLRSSDETHENKHSDKKDGENNEEQNNKKKNFQWKNFFRVTLAFLGTISIGGIIKEWGKPMEDADGKPIEDEYSEYPLVIAYLMRTYREISFQVKVTQEPSRQKLLPDPLKYPYIQPPYTLVIEMTNILVNPEWTFKTGWRFKKRPGIEYFLRAVGPPTFEVVIFTKESGVTADPIITKIDPENYIMYRLYRDATRYQDGEHIKDLNGLNRDLSRVILIDWNKEAIKLNPDNSFILKKWDGDMNDTALGELAEFLRAIAASKVDDVRPVLKYYSQFDDPMAHFHENQRKLKEEQEKQIQAQQTRDAKSLTGIWNKVMR